MAHGTDMTNRETLPCPDPRESIRARMKRFSGYRSILACWVAALIGER